MEIKTFSQAADEIRRVIGRSKDSRIALVAESEDGALEMLKAIGIRELFYGPSIFVCLASGISLLRGMQFNGVWVNAALSDEDLSNAAMACRWGANQKSAFVNSSGVCDSETTDYRKTAMVNKFRAPVNWASESNINVRSVIVSRAGSRCVGCGGHSPSNFMLTLQGASQPEMLLCLKCLIVMRDQMVTMVEQIPLFERLADECKAS